jgi:hypothetical protein
LSSRLISKNLKIKIYKTVILLVVLYGCETWSLTLREEDVLWRKFHNDKLHSLYFSTNIFRVIKSRRMRWAVNVARMVEGRSVYRVLVGSSEGNRSLGRPRRKWEDNIKMDLRETGIDGANWIYFQPPLSLHSYPMILLRLLVRKCYWPEPICLYHFIP